MNVDVRQRSRPANALEPAIGSPTPAGLVPPAADPETPPPADRSSGSGTVRTSHSGGNFLLDIAAVPTPLPREYCQPGHEMKLSYVVMRLWRTVTQKQHFHRLLLGTFISCFLFYVVALRPMGHQYKGSSRTLLQALERRMDPSQHNHRDCLTAYVFQEFDDEALANLRFFVDNAMDRSDRCEYVVVVQRANNQTELSWLPALPTNARYVFNPFYMQECNDWGIFGWLVTSGHIKPTDHQYFFFLNSGIRGPYFPAYLKGQFHWTTPFINKLTGNVKLVGPSVRCVNVKQCKTEEEPDGVEKTGPALQHLWATDQVGLKVILDEGGVFNCHHEPDQALCRSELGASLAMFEAGFTVDSLMLRYQGVDWTQRGAWGCNAQQDPLSENQYDGVTVDPLETMFIKMDRDAVESEVYSAMKALKYGLWAAALKKGNPALLADNEFAHPGINKFKAWKIIEMWGRGQACFDFKYYYEQNEDTRTMEVKNAWSHFLTNGQFEGRKYRFKCNVDADSARVQLVKATGLDVNM